MKIGLIGLGRMGGAIRSASPNRAARSSPGTAEKATQLAAGRGVKIAANPKVVAAEAEMVISIITEDNGVRRSSPAPTASCQPTSRGKLFIEMSTLQPMTGRELAPMVEAKGARLIEFAGARHHPEVHEGKLFASSAAGPKMSSARERCSTS